MPSILHEWNCMIYRWWAQVSACSRRCMAYNSAQDQIPDMALTVLPHYFLHDRMSDAGGV
jgi:hypothetical protein